VDEIEAAYQRYRDTLVHIMATGDWGLWADQLTEDAVLRYPGWTCVGREPIRAMVLTLTSTSPGNLVAAVEIGWHTINHPRGQVVQEVRRTLRDPGDGSVHFALSTTMLTYAGDGLWSGIDHTHNPEAVRAMYRGWARAAQRCGVELDPALQLTLQPAAPIA
jgi:hypothetical protein